MNLKLYVINLSSRPDRLIAISEQLDAQGLKFQRIDAVDGRLREPSEFIHYKRDQRLKYFDDLEPGEIGCCESHFLSLDTFLKQSEKEYCLVLEDDALLPDNFSHTLDTLINQKKGWDLIRLQRSKKQRGPVVDTVNNHQVIFPLMVGLKTTGLLYTRKGAHETRKLFANFIFPADHVLKFTHLVGVWTYEVNPTYIEQDAASISDIGCKVTPFRQGTKFYSMIWMKMYRILAQGIRLFLMPIASLRWRKV